VRLVVFIMAITLQLPALYAKQAAFVNDTARYTACEASTKSGKTIGCMTWLLREACNRGGPGRNFWWIAPIYQQAAIAYTRMANWLRGTPGIPRMLFACTDSRQTIRLANGAVLWFKGADNEDSLYGEDVYAAVIDEASRCSEAAWYAIRTTITATQAPVKLIGNVQGTANWFYRMCRQAQAGKENWSYHHLTAYDAVAGGVLAAEEIEDAKRTLPEWAFRELYLADASDSLRVVFAPQGLDAQRPNLRDPILTLDYAIKQRREGTGQYAVLVPAHNGPIKVYMLPSETPDKLPFGLVEVERSFGMGADVSEGVGASDSVAEVFACDNMEQACEFASNKVSPSDFGRVLAALGQYYNEALVCPVRKLHGVTTLRARIGVRWIDAIAKRTPILRCVDTLDQHRQYIYDEAGRITQQALAELPPHVRDRHGDRVIACALALRACGDSPVFARTVKATSMTWAESVYGPGGYKQPGMAEAKKW